MLGCIRAKRNTLLEGRVLRLSFCQARQFVGQVKATVHAYRRGSGDVVEIGAIYDGDGHDFIPNFLLTSFFHCVYVF